MKLYSEIEKPIIVKSGNKNHKQFLMSNKEPIVFQTDPCKIVAIKNDPKNPKKLIIALDIGMDMEDWFRSVQERLETNFNNFRPFLEKDLMIKAEFNGGGSGGGGGINEGMGTMCFNRQKQFLPLSKLQVGDSIICILTTTGIWSDEVSSNLVWKAKQIVKL